MKDLHQTALDYCLGILPGHEVVEFEALIAKDPDATVAYTNALDDLGLIGQSSPEVNLASDLRQRILNIAECDNSSSTIPSALPRTSPPFHGLRYSGGGASVDLLDIRDTIKRSAVENIYETMIGLTPFVSGSSAASSGDLRELQEHLSSIPSSPENIPLASQIPLQNDYWANGKNGDLSSFSLKRVLLTSLPSLNFFISKLSSGEGGICDVRRVFYLCRDQLKIMRSCFGDLDKPRLSKDEEIRHHGTSLLRSKWWGANHTFVNQISKASLGHFFDGPITERCVEYAEYDSNVYSLANLLATLSSDKNFQINLYKDKIPDVSLAVITAPTIDSEHVRISQLFCAPEEISGEINQFSALVQLVLESVGRAFRFSNVADVLDSGLVGCERVDQSTSLWFSWPVILPLNQEGALAETSNPDS
ncbi:MAG: hypothetical protein HOD72_04185 [Opitutae bacterium]|nr:hypothetical protein [Opitutae bacterium]MBT6463712.1 hypothetical protein [Opitutae bacterium]